MRATIAADCETLVRLTREDLLRLEKSLTREWLETNGLGGFASSTVVACATRRYHGLLVCPFSGTVQRHVFLSRFEETLHGADREEPISLARYGSGFSPPGHRSIESFELCPWPKTTYRIGAMTVSREVVMPTGRAAVLVRYSWQRDDVAEGPVPTELRLRPLLACRRADAETFENLVLDPRIKRFEGGLRMQPYEALPALLMTMDQTVARFEADPLWYHGVEYSVELERGYGGHEDLFSPGILHVDLSRADSIVLAASIDDVHGGAIEDPVRLFEQETSERRERAARIEHDVRGYQSLVAEDFLYRDEHGRRGIVAGWPWFLEWGRDTFLSLPGLTIARGDEHLDECGSILDGALRFLEGGLLPNIYGKDRADSHYGSVDASLWFVRAVRLYENAGGEDIAERFLPALREIASSYRDGAGGFVRLDDSGLIRAGRPDLNATWMDARASDGPVTPRDGYPVEIEALWCFLLRYLEILEERTGNHERAGVWAGMRRRAYTAFLEHFWLDEERYLADSVKGDVADIDVRPNMTLAASFEFSPLTRAQRQGVVEATERYLVTPRGLRTLWPKSPAYRGVYRGDQDTRDRAYHQGTVWPWLLGGYVEASLRAFGDDALRRANLRALLDGFDDHLTASGLLHVSEVFDGDPPHRPGGTIAQAWSCAEILRSYWLLDREPSFFVGEEGACAS
ncbi:MAG: glycogen debranching enzyme family protein [Planctomycetes bacterium]|nr:glycogen debranching enzyme family protein [Planctomycetota bacterium]